MNIKIPFIEVILHKLLSTYVGFTIPIKEFLGVAGGGTRVKIPFTEFFHLSAFQLPKFHCRRISSNNVSSILALKSESTNFSVEKARSTDTCVEGTDKTTSAIFFKSSL